MTMAQQHTAKRVAWITLKGLCESLNLQLEDDGKNIVVTAGGGVRFIEDDTHLMVFTYADHAKNDYGHKQEVIAQAYSFIQGATFTDCPDDCEWCYA